MKAFCLISSICLNLLLCAGVTADPLTYQKEFELQLCPEGTPLAPPLRGDAEATMQLVRQIYDLAGPKIGSRFVESCYLLCLGDLRPYGAWNGWMVAPEAQDDEVLDRINRFLVPRGYSLHMHKAEGGRLKSFSIHSLEGLDKRTRETRLNWIPRYRRETGWAGYYQWKSQIWSNLDSKDPNRYDKIEGVMLGYPDAAVERYSELVWSNWPSTVSIFLPEAYTYDCGVPIFQLRWQDWNEPGVMTLQQEWREFLRRAYESPTHKALAGEVDFVNSRRQKLESEKVADGFPMGNPSYLEVRRLGYSCSSPAPEPDSEMERWLAQNAAQVAAALRESPDLQLVAESTAFRRLTSQHLWWWILRGSSESQGEARLLFESMQQYHPQALLTLYRGELSERITAIRNRGKGSNAGWDGEGLARMLNSPYCREVFPSLPVPEQKAVFEAVESRRTHPPLRRLMFEAQQGKGPYASALNRLQRDQPGLWAP